MKEKLIDSKVLTQVALKSCQFKQNLSPGVAVMLSSPSAVRQVDGIDDSWEAQVNQAMINSQKRGESNIF